jgi:CRISPR/Cas system CSM-associated protein Csm2 small subunit
MTYQLDKNVSEDFDFEVGGFVYKMKYPTGEERREIEGIYRKMEELNKEATAAEEKGNDTDQFKPKAESLAKEMSDKIDSLVSCDNDKAPKVSEVINNATAPVVRAYTKMLREEMSLEVAV